MFMWVTMPKLNEVFHLFPLGGGFEYKTVVFTWIKMNKRQTDTLFTGMGRWTRCMTGDTLIWVYDTNDNIVELTTLANLNNIETKLIHTRNGWKKIYNKINSGYQPYHTFKTKLANINVSSNHELLFKRPVSSQGKSRLICEFGTISDYKHFVNLSAVRKQNYKVNLLYSCLPVESPNAIKSVYDIELSYEIGWLLGLFLAEGNFGIGSASNQIRFSLNAKEVYIYEKLYKIIDNLNLYGDRYFNKKVIPHKFIKDNRLSVYFSKKLIKDFILYFSYGKGSKGKRLNLNVLYQTPANFRHGIIDGMLEGDGHFLNNSQWKLVLANKQLIDDFSKLMFSIGIQNKISSQKPLYKNNTLCYKYQLICLKNRLITFQDTELEYVTIDNFIENSGFDELFDITVEDGDFIANHIVSHNSNSELCLLATKGKLQRISASVHSVVMSPIEEHSKKPNEVRERIVQLLGDLPRIELFARQEVEGWKNWGNHV